MSDHFQFGPKTFAYFRGASKHASHRAWFEEHRSLYSEGVEMPFSHLVNELREALSPALPGIVFSPCKITKPLLRRMKDADGPALRQTATAYFSEPPTSMFEMNPGVYLSFGAKPEDNVVGCGLYMPSARQIRELRIRFATQTHELRSILQRKSLQAHWGGLSGDRYKRYPKDCDEDGPGSEFFWHKQFYLGKQFSREEICKSSFIHDTVQSLVVGLPFLTWTRNAVGLYRKPV